MKSKKSESRSRTSNRGDIYIISGPSGVGKGTICRQLLKDNPQLVFSVSATTRAPRYAEVDGREYFFVSRERFEQMIREGLLLEYDEHFGNYYGTPFDYVERNLSDGKDVILEIECNGARTVKQKCPDAKMIFIVPPSLEELFARLNKRNSESQQQIEERLNRVKMEMELAKDYDLVVVNDTVENAVKQIESFIEKVKENK